MPGEGIKHGRRFMLSYQTTSRKAFDVSTRIEPPYWLISDSMLKLEGDVQNE